MEGFGSRFHACLRETVLEDRFVIAAGALSNGPIDPATDGARARTLRCDHAAERTPEAKARILREVQARSQDRPDDRIFAILVGIEEAEEMKRTEEVACLISLEPMAGSLPESAERTTCQDRYVSEESRGGRLD